MFPWEDESSMAAQLESGELSGELATAATKARVLGSYRSLQTMDILQGCGNA